MNGFRIGRLFGIDLRVHASWFIIAGLVTWSLYSSALPVDFPGLGAGARLVMAAGIAFFFFASLLGHELAHSLMAIRRGIPVRRITLFLFGGMAQTGRESRTPGEEFLIAAAGPLASFVLAAMFAGLWYVAAGPRGFAMVAGIAAYMAVLNLMLGTFNLIPGFPMDGGRILRAGIWKATGDVTRATRWASRIGVLLAYALMAYGMLEAVRGNVMGGIWLVLIAFFIRNAARSSYRQHLLAQLEAFVQGGAPGMPGFPGAPHPPLRGRDVRPLGFTGRDVTGLGHNEV